MLPSPGSPPVEWRISDSLVAYDEAVAFMEARAEGAPMRIRDATNAQLNPEGRNLYDELSRLTATQKEKAAPFFAQADKTPILT